MREERERERRYENEKLQEKEVENEGKGETENTTAGARELEREREIEDEEEGGCLVPCTIWCKILLGNATLLPFAAQAVTDVYPACLTAPPRGIRASVFDSSYLNRAGIIGTFVNLLAQAANYILQIERNKPLRTVDQPSVN